MTGFRAGGRQAVGQAATVTDIADAAKKRAGLGVEPSARLALLRLERLEHGRRDGAVASHWIEVLWAELPGQCAAERPEHEVVTLVAGADVLRRWAARWIQRLLDEFILPDLHDVLSHCTLLGGFPPRPPGGLRGAGADTRRPARRHPMPQRDAGGPNAVTRKRWRNQAPARAQRGGNATRRVLTRHRDGREEERSRS